jgi:hypothetical protein
VKLRTFTVPFSKLNDEMTELEFGPDDVMVVRPLFTLSRDAAANLATRMGQVEQDALAARKLPADDPERVAVEEASDLLILDVIRTAIVSWRLTDENGVPIKVPESTAELDALPSGLAASLYPFLQTYRGDGPNPTTRS